MEGVHKAAVQFECVMGVKMEGLAKLADSELEKWRMSKVVISGRVQSIRPKRLTQDHFSLSHQFCKS